MSTDAERIAILEARVEALSATIKTVLTTLVLRGTLTKPAVDAILREVESLFPQAPASRAQIQTVRDDLPGVLRAAMGPESDPDDHGH
jgi:hypothetical protein